MNELLSALTITACLFAAALSAQQGSAGPSHTDRSLLAGRDTGVTQPLGSIPDGVRVRVWSMSAGLARAQGRIQGTAGDTLLFQMDGCDSTCTVVRLPAAALDRLQVVSGRNHAKGALLGGLIGVAVGGLVGAIGSSKSCSSSGSDGSLDSQAAVAVKCLGGAIAGPIIGGGIGGLVGALLGGASGAGDTWRDVPGSTPTVILGMSPERRGVALSLRASF